MYLLQSERTSEAASRCVHVTLEHPGYFVPSGRISVTGHWIRVGNVEDAELHPCAEERYGMVMPETTRKWTREMVLALPDDERPEILGERVVWHPAGAVEPLLIDLSSLFREVCGRES